MTNTFHLVGCFCSFVNQHPGCRQHCSEKGCEAVSRLREKRELCDCLVMSAMAQTPSGRGLTGSISPSLISDRKTFGEGGVAVAFFPLAVPLCDSNEGKAISKEDAVMERCPTGA